MSRDAKSRGGIRDGNAAGRIWVGRRLHQLIDHRLGKAKRLPKGRHALRPDALVGCVIVQRGIGRDAPLTRPLNEHSLIGWAVHLPVGRHYRIRRHAFPLIVSGRQGVLEYGTDYPTHAMITKLNAWAQPLLTPGTSASDGPDSSAHPAHRIPVLARARPPREKQTGFLRGLFLSSLL